MMRSGHLLAEESPQDLLEKYAMPTLEDVFLKLCMKDGSKRHTVAAANETPYNTVGRRKQTSQGGHDNMAFEHTMSQLDVSRVGVEGRHLNNSYHPASLARYTVVSALFYSWKFLKEVSTLRFQMLQVRNLEKAMIKTHVVVRHGCYTPYQMKN